MLRSDGTVKRWRVTGPTTCDVCGDGRFIILDPNGRLFACERTHAAAMDHVYRFITRGFRTSRSESR